jgi:hypothetical protein
MSEHEGESKTLSAFFLGFALGCLLCVGAGGAFFWVQNRRLMEAEMEARMQAEDARARAEEAHRAAEAERLALEKRLKQKGPGKGE